MEIYTIEVEGGEPRQTATPTRRKCKTYINTSFGSISLKEIGIISAGVVGLVVWVQVTAWAWGRISGWW